MPSTNGPKHKLDPRHPGVSTNSTGRAKHKPQPTKEERHPVLSTIWLGVSGGLLLLTLALALVVIVIPKATGSVPLTVTTGSMDPHLPIGTLLVVRPVAPADIAVGDIISYQPYPMNPTLVTHRVTALSSNSEGQFVFRLRGDANGQDDPPVYGKQVRARYWYSIPLLGYVNSRVNTSGRSIPVLIAVAVLLGYGILQFIRGFKARRQQPTETIGM